MFSRTGPAAIKPNLDNTEALCGLLDKPQEKFKSIHVAGTNGKGSVSHMLASIFQEQGFKTGLYTSPHLKDFRERIRINGIMISEEAVMEYTQSIIAFLEEKEPSFFEATVGMAFKYFADQKVDIAVIETGLGGRLDSTNVITPEISVITNIGLDHTALLGSTHEAIAKEKAGIIKKGRPVVIGAYLPETKKVFLEKATQSASEIHFAADEYEIVKVHHDQQELCLDIKSINGNTISVCSKLNGIYQKENIRTVVASIDTLNQFGWNIEQNVIRRGIRNTAENTGLRGRWETVQENPRIILDVGHNADGMKQIIQQLSITPFNTLHIILGMSKDKDYREILSLLPKDAIYLYTQANIPRALDAKKLKEEAEKFGLKGDVEENVSMALEIAKSRASKDDLILICGSVFIVGELNI